MTKSHCSQDGLELAVILLPELTDCRDYRCGRPMIPGFVLSLGWSFSSGPMSVKKKSPSLLPSQLLGRSIWNLLFFLRQGFHCVTLLAVLEVALVDQVNLKLRDPPASVS